MSTPSQDDVRAIIAALHGLISDDEEEQGRTPGFGDAPSSTRLIYVGGNGSTRWYRFNGDAGEQEPIEAECLYGHLRAVEAVTVTSERFGDSTKLRVYMETDETVEVLQVGVDTTFASYLLAAMNKASSLDGLVGIEAREGNTPKVTLSNFYEAGFSRPVITSEEDLQDWQDLLPKIAERTGQDRGPLERFDG